MRDRLSQVYLKACISPDLERSDFNRQSFQYIWLNSYLLFSSNRESLNFAQAYSTWPYLSSFDKVISLFNYLLASPVLDLVYTTGLVRVNTDTPLQDRYPTGSGYNSL